MPELPEVETVCRGIQKELEQMPRILKVEFYRKDLRVPMPMALSKILVGETFTNIRRRAKYLLFDTSKISVLSHLGMSGSWRFQNEGLMPIPRLKHDHCVITFEGGKKLIFHDPRRFGLIEYFKQGEEHKSKWLKNLGVEPLSNALSVDYLMKAAKNKSVLIKTFIMDQKYVVGVGNIYVSEALFLAKIKPTRKVSTVKRVEWAKLIEAIQNTLSSAIDSGGTTLRDYRQASGLEGNFQKKLYVYNRKTQRCLRCGEKIQFKMIQSRSTYWCKNCQK